MAIEHPEYIDDKEFIGGCRGCPWEYGYLPKDAAICAATQCSKCWDREIPEEGALARAGKAALQIAENCQKATEAFTAMVGTIKDSGDRTEFETGAVRDMREGKGRCDLMPLEVSAIFIGNHNDRAEAILFSLSRFQRIGSTVYLYDALRAFGHGCWEDPFSMFLEVAKHFEEGAKKYGENNWQKGIPVHCYIDSAVRHYLKWLRGDKDEPHDRAFVWNLMCCIWEVDYREKTNERSE
jgi:hypothetical protein